MLMPFGYANILANFYSLFKPKINGLVQIAGPIIQNRPEFSVIRRLN